MSYEKMKKRDLINKAYELEYENKELRRTLNNGSTINSKDLFKVKK